METKATGRALADHWTWTISKGLMNPKTARALRRACESVLSVYEDWEDLDVRKLDVEDALTRFRNLKSRNFKPSSIPTYESRFQRAVASYLEYLDDPGGWKPKQRAPRPQRPPKAARRKTEPDEHGRYTDEEGVFRETVPDWLTNQLPVSKLMDYPFPLRDGVIAHLLLPRDLSAKDVRRLTAFMETLVIEADD